MNSNWRYSPETAKLGYDLCDLDLWPMTLTFCMDITSVIGNNFLMERWQEHSDEKGVTDRQTDGRTDRQTERGVLRAAWSQLKRHDVLLNQSLTILFVLTPALYLLIVNAHQNKVASHIIDPLVGGCLSILQQPSAADIVFMGQRGIMFQNRCSFHTCHSFD